ncbi:MAG: hypothetical protein GX657_00410 [Chloroflexi bacterium]|nr:hypothetical protein [Chloroflexota bacterium]
MVQNANAARRSADYTARSVQEAVERAAADLRVPAEQLDYTVLRDNTHTILGLVRTGEATIRVWWKEPEPAEPAMLPSLPAEEEAAGTEEVADREDWAEYADAEDVDAEDVDVEDLEEADDDLAEEGEGTLAGDVDEEDEDVYEEDERPASTAARAATPQDLARVTSDVVSRLLDGMGLYAAVEVVERGGQVDPETQEVAPLQVNIIGDGLGVLIGRRGETLRDLQFLTRLIVSRQIGKWPNLVVDVEGYKARRADALEGLARRMADRVRTTRQPVVLEPMPAYERRIVHMTLRGDKDVYTESIGEGESRKVQILLKG